MHMAAIPLRIIVIVRLNMRVSFYLEGDQATVVRMDLFYSCRLVLRPVHEGYKRV